MDGKSVNALPGDIAIRGAVLTGEGAFFSQYSENATGARVHLYDDKGTETDIVTLNSGGDSHVWNGFVPGLKEGQRYHLSFDGEYAPERGLRFNPDKRLLDPYAIQFDGSFAGSEILDEANFGYQWNHPAKDLEPSSLSNAGVLPKCVLTAPISQEGRPERPRTRKEELVIVETHVDDTTRNLSPALLPEGVKPGSILAMASDPVIDVLNATGTNAVQLLPISEFPEEGPLVAKGLTQHWGYNTVGFMAPTQRYGTLPEYAQFVDKMHENGKAVILDIVMNHSAEGDECGPTFHLKGIDNTTYYELCGDKRYYNKDNTGVGNRLNTNHPETRRLIVETLKFYRQELKVDGFRFDLARALFLDRNSQFDPDHPLFAEINEAMQEIDRKEGSEPTFLIAESWDCRGSAYGQYPEGWMQQTCRDRDRLRDAAQGKLSAPELHDVLYGPKAHDTVAFVTAHDGFTLNDMVSYEVKHNEANGENNADGHSDNHSCNGGIEGGTDNFVVNSYRERVKLHAMFLLAASKTAIMRTMSDIFHHQTQFGNNNSYCRKNPIDWSRRDPAWEDELGRQSHLHQEVIAATGVETLESDGHTVYDAGTIPGWKKAIGEKLDADGEEIVVCVNGSHNDVPFTLPGEDWTQVAGDGGGSFYTRAFKKVMHPAQVESRPAGQVTNPAVMVAHRPAA